MKGFVIIWLTIGIFYINSSSNNIIFKKIARIKTYGLLLTATAFNLFAQDYYVAPPPFGSDSNLGTETDPFATINKGVQVVEPGGTVYVMNGTYQNNGYNTVSLNPYTNTNNPAVVTINKSGEPGNYITLKNYDGHAPKIEFDGGGGIKIANGVNYVIVEGFKIEGPNEAIDYNLAIADRNYKVQRFNETGSGTAYNNEVNYFSGKGIWGYGPHNNLIIRNNEVYNTPGSGIRFNDGDHITIEYNTIYNTTWWTSSASSAIVFAETIAASEADNTTEAKMIIRGNVVYNNWNRIPFFMATDPDNSITPSEEYGNAEYTKILDGQGIYVTRSDSNYKGTFLIENNLCVNNGKNGINFDRSLEASVVIQNNTIYFNGVHEIIQDISTEVEGNPAHRGQKVGGIKANYIKNITVANNIVVTRDSNFSALETPNFTGVRTVTNNLFLNGKLPTNNDTGQVYGFITCCNQVNEDPLFVSAPTIANDAENMTQWAGYLNNTDFSLSSNSPAINAGNANYSPALDINKNPRPISSNEIISSSSFETALDGWYNFGNINVAQSTETAKTGTKSLKVSNRADNYHSPRIDLNNILTVGETYTFYVWVKLAQGSGTVQLKVKSTVNGATTEENVDTYTNLSSDTATASGWIQLKDDYTHTQNDKSFLYVIGPEVSNGAGVDYYIDDFSLVNQGIGEVDFSNAGNIIDIGAYEYSPNPLSYESPIDQTPRAYAYPNPTKDKLTLINLKDNESIAVYDLLGKYHFVRQQKTTGNLNLNVSMLKAGIYFIHVSNAKGATKTISFIKN